MVIRFGILLIYKAWSLIRGHECLGDFYNPVK